MTAVSLCQLWFFRKTRREEFVIDTPYEVPTALLQSSECAQLMQALGASRKELSSIELLTVPPPDASSEPPCCWVVSQRMTADDLSTRVDKLEQYLSLPEDVSNAVHTYITDIFYCALR